MTTATHQTVKLSRGRHASPEQGVCVMELASMLAGERFSDHPASVCPVIASLLRTYNDSVDEGRRQDLYAYAASAVGTTATAEMERRREAHLVEWTARRHESRGPRSLLPARLRRVGLGMLASGDTAAFRAVRVAVRHGKAGHGEMLALLDELIAIGAASDAAPAAPAQGAPYAGCQRADSARSGPDGLCLAGVSKSNR